MRIVRAVAFAAVVVVLDHAAVAGGKAAAYHPVIDSQKFDATVDNPYFPLPPGTVWAYEERQGKRVTLDSVTVTSQTRVVMGVRCVVVHDVERTNGRVGEDTYDCYAQDHDGNVWYFGEDTKEFAPDGSVSTEGSWEAGVNGEPGVIMLAHPEVGVSYPQEQAPGIAEDMGKVISLDASVTVPYGSFDHALQTLEWSLIEHGQGAREEKTYVNGLGLVLESSRSGKMRTELISVTHE